MQSVSPHPSSVRPIDVPELLAIVFSYLDDRSLARTARVCRHWSDAALDTLWYKLTDLRPLLNLLAPLTNERKGASRVLPPAYIVCQSSFHSNLQ